MRTEDLNVVFHQVSHTDGIYFWTCLRVWSQSAELPCWLLVTLICDQTWHLSAPSPTLVTEVGTTRWLLAASKNKIHAQRAWIRQDREDSEPCASDSAVLGQEVPQRPECLSPFVIKARNLRLREAPPHLLGQDSAFGLSAGHCQGGV